jgi:hypothetical protein
LGLEGDALEMLKSFQYLPPIPFHVPRKERMNVPGTIHRIVVRDTYKSTEQGPPQEYCGSLLKGEGYSLKKSKEGCPKCLRLKTFQHLIPEKQLPTNYLYCSILCILL